MSTPRATRHDLIGDLPRTEGRRRGEGGWTRVCGLQRDHTTSAPTRRAAASIPPPGRRVRCRAGDFGPDRSDAYRWRYVMWPRVRSYGESSPVTRSPGRTRMELVRIV